MKKKRIRQLMRPDKNRTRQQIKRGDKDVAGKRKEGCVV
jgi:hypothetical protein